MVNRGFSPAVIWVTCVLVGGSIASPAGAQQIADRIRLLRGAETGEVTGMTATEITVKKGNSGSRSIPVNEIKSVAFVGEPAELAQARVSAANGDYKKAANLLDRVDAQAAGREFIQQDVEFYKSFCAGMLALGGEGEIAGAGRQLNSFVRSYPKSYHYLAAVELMGDLLLADGRFEQAQRQYAELAKAPWADYKMRAAIAAGRTLQAQGKHGEAIAQFDAALAMADDGASAPQQKLAATLAKAVSQAESGGLTEAVAGIERIIADADAEQKELHARAYIALGKCYERAGQTKDALLAYLHVDVLYNTVPEAHAEALAHLVPLWRAVGQDERARETRELLQQRYAGSRWTKELP
jgi:tetratricopeptide (TPR) repeat protein